MLKLGYIYSPPDEKSLRHAFRGSVRLKRPVAINTFVSELPLWVPLTPMSYYHVPTWWYPDPSRTLSLPRPVENASLRFATRFAYLGALVPTYLEPRQGRDWALEGPLQIDIARLLECGLA